ncbi:MAG: ShlB/FhaC/HecB family hemolysin secretion/activation protein [Burkholderiales bacterium]
MAAGLLLCCFSVWAQSGTAPAPAPKFDIQAFVVEGNTLIPQKDVDELVAPFTGKQRDFGDIQKALEALQAEYLERGYNAVRVLVPEQDIQSGHVHLKVIEARVRDVRIEGNKFYSNENIRGSLPALKEGQAPNTREIGANVTLANENPIRQERVVLQATPEEGKVDAVVRVIDDDPWRTTLFFDNTGNDTTGYNRAGIGFLNANFGGVDHVLNLQAITSPTQWDDVQIFGAGYRVPLYGANALFDVYGGHSDVNSGTLQSLFTVAGAGNVAGARYTQVLPRQGSYEQKLSLGVEWKAFENSVFLVGGSPTLVPNVTTIPATLAYVGRAVEPGRDVSFYVSYSHNLPQNDGDASGAAIEASRPGTPPNFSYWRAGFAYTKALPQDNLFRLVADGQYTREPLVPGEQYGLGGIASVRGFFERVTANDVGHHVQIEYYGPDVGKVIGGEWKARILGFLDFGRGNDQAPIRLETNGMASVGFGIRANRGKNWSLRLDTALVTNGAANVEAGSVRTDFGIVYTF